jgi:hypothetical protein
VRSTLLDVGARRVALSFFLTRGADFVADLVVIMLVVRPVKKKIQNNYTPT